MKISVQDAHNYDQWENQQYRHDAKEQARTRARREYRKTMRVKSHTATTNTTNTHNREQ